MTSINPNAKGDKRSLQEEGERSRKRERNTCKPMAVSFQCMTKFTRNKKKKKKKERESEGKRENGHPHGASRNESRCGVVLRGRIWGY